MHNKGNYYSRLLAHQFLHKISYGCPSTQANGYTCIPSLSYCKRTECTMPKFPFLNDVVQDTLVAKRKKEENKDEAPCYTDTPKRVKLAATQST